MSRTAVLYQYSECTSLVVFRKKQTPIVAWQVSGEQTHCQRTAMPRPVTAVRNMLRARKGCDKVHFFGGRGWNCHVRLPHSFIHPCGCLCCFHFESVNFKPQCRVLQSTDGYISVTAVYTYFPPRPIGSQQQQLYTLSIINSTLAHTTTNTHSKICTWQYVYSTPQRTRKKRQCKKM